MEENRERKKHGGTAKIILGSLSLLTVFATPFLNITQLSLNMTLFQSAAYSFLLLSFWLIAGSILHDKHTVPQPISFPQQRPYRRLHRKPVASA